MNTLLSSAILGLTYTNNVKNILNIILQHKSLVAVLATFIWFLFQFLSILFNKLLRVSSTMMIDAMLKPVHNIDSIKIPYLSQNGKVSWTYMALMKEIYNTMRNSNRPISLKEFCHDNECSTFVLDENIIKDNKEFVMSNGIQISSTKNEMILSSTYHKSDYLINYIDKIKKKYRDTIFEPADDTLLIFNHIKNHNFEEYNLVTEKNFNNIFFKQKDRLLSILDKFADHITNPRPELPQNLGLLFFGPPGCGKTSVIKALAQYTKRHLIMISLKLMNDPNHLKQAICSTIINSKHIQYSKSIIVIEDIDTVDVSRENKDIDIGTLLNVIDGVIETKGRILIVTSNYPDKIDQAMLRPGRIDHKIEFSYPDKITISEMLKYYYSDFYELSQDIYNILHNKPVSFIEYNIVQNKTYKDFRIAILNN